MHEVVKAIANNYEMLDAIRQHRKTEFTVETLRESLCVSRATADKMVWALRNAGVIERQEKGMVIDGKIALFLGISIGSTHTRVQLLDLDFKALSREDIKEYSCLKKLENLPQFEKGEADRECLAYLTPQGNGNQFEALQELISGIIMAFLQQARASKEDKNAPNFPLMGIGLAVTGPVDYMEQTWQSAPRQLTEIRNISLFDLIGYECYQAAEKLEIFFSLDNNAKTAMISEYQYLLEENSGQFCEDIALIYIGSGVGSSAVLDKRLLRGSHNLSGELGYLRVTVPTEDGGYTTQTIDECLAGTGDEKKDIERYNTYLPYVLNTINCLLGIDRVILVGHSIRKTDSLIPSLMGRRMQFTVASTQHYCRLETGRGKAGTSAIGAAIEAYMTMCRYNEDCPQERTNLANDICWK